MRDARGKLVRLIFYTVEELEKVVRRAPCPPVEGGGVPIADTKRTYNRQPQGEGSADPTGESRARVARGTRPCSPTLEIELWPGC